MNEQDKLQKPKLKEIVFTMPKLGYSIMIDFKELSKSNLSLDDYINLQKEKFLKDIPELLEKSFMEQHPKADDESISTAVDFALGSMDIDMDDSDLFKPVEVWTLYLAESKTTKEFDSLTDFSYYLRNSGLALTSTFDLPANSVVDINTFKMVGRFTHRYFISNKVFLFSRYHSGKVCKVWRNDYV